MIERPCSQQPAIALAGAVREGGEAVLLLAVGIRFEVSATRKEENSARRIRNGPLETCGRLVLVPLWEWLLTAPDRLGQRAGPSALISGSRACGRFGSRWAWGAPLSATRVLGRGCCARSGPYVIVWAF